jgi:hypothetical protein
MNVLLLLAILMLLLLLLLLLMLIVPCCPLVSARAVGKTNCTIAGSKHGSNTRINIHSASATYFLLLGGHLPKA